MIPAFAATTSNRRYRLIGAAKHAAASSEGPVVDQETCIRVHNLLRFSTCAECGQVTSRL